MKPGKSGYAFFRTGLNAEELFVNVGRLIPITLDLI
jgi:hypothetical protein